jgi:hypothetical protein
MVVASVVRDAILMVYNMFRDGLLVTAWMFGIYGALILGCLGQTAFMSPVVKPYLPAWMVVPIFILPYLLVFLITYFKRSFLSPRQFRFCLIFAMGWFAAVTIVAEILCQLGYMPPDSPAYGRTMARVLMHVGWLSFIPLICLYVLVRQAESQQMSDNSPSHQPSSE